VRRPVLDGEWSAPTHLAWVGGDGPVRLGRRFVTVDHSLRGLGVSSPVCRELSVFDLAEVFGRQPDVDRSDVFFESLHLRSAGDRHYPGLLGEQPGERNLSRCRVLPFCNPIKDIDEGPVRLPRLRVEPGNAVTEIGVGLPRRTCLKACRGSANWLREPDFGRVCVLSSAVKSAQSVPNPVPRFRTQAFRRHKPAMPRRP
jgi:hypothetical protein